METIHEHTDGDVLFSTNKSLLDLNVIHKFLSTKSYWAAGVPIDIVRRSIENSVTIGVYVNGQQIGFARLVTDMATFAYLADVFIVDEFRQRGLSKKLMDFILSFDEMKNLRRILLATKDAHGLYAQYGFKPLVVPERFMEIHRPDIYKPSLQ